MLVGGGDSKAPEVAQRDQPMVSCDAKGKKEKEKKVHDLLRPGRQYQGRSFPISVEPPPPSALHMDVGGPPRGGHRGGS